MSARSLKPLLIYGFPLDDVPNSGSIAVVDTFARHSINFHNTIALAAQIDAKSKNGRKS